MRTLFEDIFAYHMEFNERLLAEIDKHFTILPGRTFPLFCHVMNAHQIWNARILGREPFGVQQIHPLRDCNQINRANYEDTEAILRETDLDSVISYQNSKGRKFTNTIADILFHIANHSTHHKGQIVADFRSIGIAPLVTDYIFYKREQ